MSHELRLSEDDGYDGTLSFGLHPDGELTFDDGVTSVEDESLATALSDRYPNIEYTGTSESDSEEGSDDAEADEIAQPPLNPDDHSVDELEDELAEGDYSAAELEAIYDAEEASQNRSTARDALESALNNAEE